MKSLVVELALVVAFAANHCYGCRAAPAGSAVSGPPVCAAQQPDRRIDDILDRLRQTTRKLRFYRADVEYLFEQPLFESTSLRKGRLYYGRFDDKTALLRMNFSTLKQDDQKQRKYREEYIFDGLWLTHIDFQLKAVKRYQLADPNKLKDANRPADVFGQISRNFPMVGFSSADNLKKQFEIRLLDAEANAPAATIRLHLKVRPGSVYEDDYNCVEVCIDKKTFLPAEIAAVTTEDDIYRLRFNKPRINEPIDRKIFDFKIPRGFTVEVIPLKRKDEPASAVAVPAAPR